MAAGVYIPPIPTMPTTPIPPVAPTVADIGVSAVQGVKEAENVKKPTASPTPTPIQQIDNVEKEIAKARDDASKIAEQGASQRAAKEAQDRRRRQALGIFGRGDTVGPSGNVAPIGQRKTLLGE